MFKIKFNDVKDLEDFDILRNGITCNCLALIYMVLSVAYFIEVFCGHRTSDYYIVINMVMWIPYFCSAYILKDMEFKGKWYKYCVVIMYLIFYFFALFTSEVELTWIYIFPMLCLMVIYFSFKVILITLVPVLIANLVDIFVIPHYNSLVIDEFLALGVSDSTKTAQRIACIVMCLAFLCFACYVLNKYYNFCVKLYKEANIDGVTGLNNRIATELRMKSIEKKDNEQVVAFILILVDNFARHNEVYGHKFGDKVLEKITSIIKIATKDIQNNAFISKIDLDEFCIIVTNRNKYEMKGICELIQGNVNNVILNTKGEEVVLTTSIVITDTEVTESKQFSVMYERTKSLVSKSTILGGDRIYLDSMR